MKVLNRGNEWNQYSPDEESEVQYNSNQGLIKKSSELSIL